MATKIGILTLYHNNYNWGGVLQGFALKTTLEKLLKESGSATEVNILKYNSGYNPIYPTLLKQMKQYTLTETFEKVIEKFIKKNTSKFDKRIAKRKQLFRDFMQTGTTDELVYNDDTLSDMSDRYDCLICGSDQVWNPNVVRPGYLLQSINGCIKASYSASIARDDLSETERTAMIPALEKFDFISVREKTAKNILDKYMSGRVKAEETLDPAMLLTADDWKIEESVCKKGDKKYALCFFFSDSYRYRGKIEEYCKKNNLDLYFIPFARNEYIKNDDKGNAERIYDVGPREFLYLFDNAECVFTDSFHGSAFSLIFKKQFCVFERDKNTKVSKNSRLYDLLDKFNVSDRLVRNMCEMDMVVNKKMDFSEIDEIMTSNREKSIIYLKKVIGI